MPQKLDDCLFPNASRFKKTTFNLVTNPFDCLMDNKIQILGHSGQPIKDILKFCKISDENNSNKELYYMEQSLKWNHMAPTGNI